MWPQSLLLWILFSTFADVMLRVTDINLKFYNLDEEV